MFKTGDILIHKNAPCYIGYVYKIYKNTYHIKFVNTDTGYYSQNDWQKNDIHLLWELYTNFFQKALP